MSDKIRITNDNPPIITIDALVLEMTKSGPTEIPANTPMYFLTSVNSIYKSLQDVGGPIQAIFVFTDEEPDEPGISLRHGAHILPVKPVVQFLQGPIGAIKEEVPIAWLCNDRSLWNLLENNFFFFFFITRASSFSLFSSSRVQCVLDGYVRGFASPILLYYIFMIIFI